jgi:TRAP transporter TAXI family solute receptor
MVLPQLTRKQLIISVALLLAVLALVLWGVTRYISPSPPKTVTMTTGATDGAYHAFGEKYKTYLKANGIELILQPSAGSVQNLERLSAGSNAGFVQGGLGFLTIDPDQDAEKTPLRSLSVIGYEPLWIFVPATQAKPLANGLQALQGKRIAVGAEGSGTRKVALDLLKTYQLTADNTTLDTSSGMAGAQALLDKKIDVLILIASPQSAAVQKLLEQSELAVLNLNQAEGLARRLPYLQLVSLKAGSVNPLKNLPAQDVQLLTTTANLVVHDNIHPAIAYLLLEAAREIHKAPTLLSRPGEFPHPRGTDFPLADEATRYYKDGRPFLQRFLPFWLANALQRLLLILIPLAAVGIPVVKLIPALLQFKEKNRLYRRYGQLLKLEASIKTRQLEAAEIAAAHRELDEIEAKISTMKFNLEFSDRVYTLRQHVDYVRRALHAEALPLTKPTTPSSSS